MIQTSGQKSNATRVQSLVTSSLLISLIVVVNFFNIRASQAQSMEPDEWGTPIEPGVPTNFTIYTQNFAYADPFLITDMRSGDNRPIESYDMHTLDIYRPVEGSELLENRPVIFFVHGGGWTDGYKDRFQSVSWSFTGQLGWVTVVIDYRLTSYDAFLADQYCPDRETCALPENAAWRTKAAEYPDNVGDVASSFEWTREWIAENGGNPNQIFGLGYSAGAHLIALMAMHPDYAQLRPGLRAIAALSGPYNLVDPDFKSAYRFVLAPTFGLPLDDEELADASPQVQVNGVGWLPPMMLLYAENDLRYFDTHTLTLAQSIRELDSPVEVVYLENYSHESEMGALRFYDEYPTQRIIEYFQSFSSYANYFPLIHRK